MENRFTGWTDVELSKRGIAEAHRYGSLLKAQGYVFDLAFTSVLRRATHNLWIALDELDAQLKPINHYYLGDAEEIRKAQEAVAKQGQAKG